MGQWCERPADGAITMISLLHTTAAPYIPSIFSARPQGALCREHADGAPRFSGSTSVSTVGPTTTNILAVVRKTPLSGKVLRNNGCFS